MKSLIVAAGLSIALAAPALAEGCSYGKHDQSAQMSVPPAATAQMSTPADAAMVAAEPSASTGPAAPTQPVETATATQTGTDTVKPN